jgi:hypothetical protein
MRDPENIAFIERIKAKQPRGDMPDRTPTTDLAMRDMDCAIETIATSRKLASEYRQLGFRVMADFHRDNATAAERWLGKAAKVYPRHCDSLGHAIRGTP